MSLKDLFKETGFKFISDSSLNDLTASGIESPEYVKTYLEDRSRFIPLVDFSNPKNFARFGSAEKYYYDSITNIYNTYPYDGSKREKILWELSSSGLDLYIFENDYPRTTGYAVFSTASLTATDTSTDYSTWGSYGAAGSGTYEYISFNGGPHAGQGSNVYIDPDSGEANYRKGANIYDLSENRECNLKIGGNDGNTVEFWLKKAAFNPAATQTEVLFDIFTTSSISSSLDYGRLTIEMSGHGVATNTLSPFYVTYMSGTAGISKQNIGSSLTTSSIADDNWHHYSFRFKNDGSNTSVDLFVDGEFNDNIKTGTTVDYVSGTIVGTIAALATHPSGTHSGAPQAEKGWGKLSGSVDELRFWKVWRTSKEIQTRWFDQVGGGTNTDDANTHLGLYYKFNEGITLTSSTDKNVLDYSGRISNGTWTGYSDDFSRDTGSAINECGLTSFTGSEYRDPIMYSLHPSVKTLLEEKRSIGREYDYTNPSTVYYTMPGWILDEHDANNPDNEGIIANSLWNLTQIISSYFDNTANLIKSMPSLSSVEYFSGSQKPIPFMNRILESKGFVAPEVFNALDALEDLENRDKDSLYTKKIADVKNIIYKNIYNNLTYINKSKGTEKSFRNLIRCFGVDDEIYKINMYSNNVDYILRDNFRSISTRHRVINFNNIYNSDATVYQYSSSANANSTTFISASGDISAASSQEFGFPFSVETSVVFPKRVTEGSWRTKTRKSNEFANYYPLMLTSSIFGMHTAIDSTPAQTTWNSNDYANFVVKAIKPQTFSNKAKFVLTGTDGYVLPVLSSSLINNVYDDNDFNFMVTLYPEKYPNVNEVSGTTSSDSDYIVEFTGIRSILDTTIEEFTVTGTITPANAARFLGSPKRMFIGSHRTNFSGSVIDNTDVKVNNLRVWQNRLTIDDLRLHSSDPENFSIKKPHENAYLFNTDINKVFVPNKETLLLHWGFDNVTGSDASGEFIVEDLTSGSANQITQYGFLNNLKNKQFTGKGEFFETSSTNASLVEQFITAKQNLPEVVNSEDTIQVLSNDDRYFERDLRPTFFDLYIEKSPYQNISEEMIKFLSTAVDYNNLIGQGVDKFRSEYKELELLRGLFFKDIKNAPDLDKYIEYFKWFDLAVSSMIQQVAPASSGLDERPLRNIIESHIFERSKYDSKFPSYEFKQTDPEAHVFGINELTYPWKEGHAPPDASPGNQSDNCRWFKDRAERDNIPSSGDSDVDSDRQELLDVINNGSNATLPNLSGSNGTYQGSAYALRRFPKPYKLNVDKQPQIHGGGNAHENKKVGFWDAIRKRPSLSPTDEGGLISIEPPDSKLESFKDCNDNLELNKGKRKYKFSVFAEIDGNDSGPSSVFKGDLAFPFSLYSSSVDLNPAMADLEDFQSNLAITNLHHDSYGPFSDVPMQGPFTEKFVGGRPYRHVMTNFTWDNANPDSEGERLEGWRLTASADALDLVNPGAPKSVYFREEYAKRPVNIKNIKQLTSSLYDANDQATDAFGVTRIGNYTNDYEIVMTNDRSINNRYFVKSGGELPSTSAESMAVSGVIDFAIPRRDLTGSNKFVIVNRFSAPGDPATMGEGMLDVASAQYSVYNALPFRNLSVRLPLNELHSDHTNQFGLFSDQFTVSAYDRAGEAYPGGSSSIEDPGADLNYIGTGSFHKVNRNGRKQPKYSNEYTGDLGTVSTSASYDNFFVQHQIPQTDVQYAWITASITSSYSGSALYGFEQPDFSNASLASTDLTFESISFVGSADCDGTGLSFGYYSGSDSFTGKGTIGGNCDPGTFVSDLVRTPFVGLNINVREPVTSSQNYLGFPAGTPVFDSTVTNIQYFNRDFIENGTVGYGATALFNALVLHRQGPYGGANWKLYRKDNHPIVRAHRSENRLSYLDSKFITLEDDTHRITYDNIASVIEPPITSRFKPLVHNLSASTNPLPVGTFGGTNATSLVINHSYMNNIMFFTDHGGDKINLNSKILDTSVNVKTEQQMLDVINYYLLSSQDFAMAPEFNPIKGLNFYRTTETIYPKEQYTYLKTHRQRDSFQNGFWRDSITTRQELGSPDGFFAAGSGPAKDIYKFGINIGEGSGKPTDRFFYQPENSGTFSASIWPLDARKDFVTNSPGRIRQSPSEGLVVQPSGAPNFTFGAIMSASDGAGILQNGTLPYSSYLYLSHSNPTSTPNFLELLPIEARLLPQYNRRIAGVIASDTSYEYKFGDTKWEAGEQSGKAPFYDTYEDYIEDIKRVGKDHSIIPEFRISEHMDFYLNESENGFLSEPAGAYEITGSSLSSNAQTGFEKEYLHTDFLKTFSLVNDSYDDLSSPEKVTLSADALIKFLPYDGFYPADRTVQLAKLFHDSYSGSFAITGTVIGDSLFPIDVELGSGDVLNNLRIGYISPVWKSLFAPGILYNSIKSGIAVDYPVHTKDVSLSVTGEPNQRNTIGYLKDIPRIDSDFDFRVPFEALLDPDGELGSRGIIENEPHPSASVNLTASLSTAGKNNYKLAMNNFLASTIDFFKPDGNLTTLASLPDTSRLFGTVAEGSGRLNKDLGFVAGKEYKMRLVCFNGALKSKAELKEFLQDGASVQQVYHSTSYDGNPQSCIMYAQTGSDTVKLMDYYGSSFGPPVQTVGGQFDPTDLTSGARFNFSSASYEPYTPAYYDGYGHIEFTFRPEFPEDFADLITISSLLTQSYARSVTQLNGYVANSYSSANRGPRNAMSMTASFNVSLVTQPSIVYDKLGNAIEIKDDDSGGTVMTIQPKWETPILNFKDVDVTLPDIGSGSVARGIWHQYGRKPRRNEGIYMQIQDLDISELDDPTMTGSLAKQLGFRQDPIRLGTVAAEKKISEAIVAIPYYSNVLGLQKKFSIPRDTIEAAIALIEEKNETAERVGIGQNEPTQEIIDMVYKMQKFVIPPHLDFVTNKEIEPFAMFIFDFEVTLKEKDLTDIWQNLSPEIGRSFTKTNASLPIRVFGADELKGRPMLSVFPDNTRWKVFKAKQRAAYNYFAKTSDSSDDERFSFNFEFGSAGAEKKSIPDYSYNWPFDFFSLIELAKIDAQVESTVDSVKTTLPLTGAFQEGAIDKNLGFSLVKSKTISELNLEQFAGPGGPATPAPEE